MGPWALKHGRLDLRPETCPPSEHVHSQGPRYVLEPGLFLGLFDVTRRCTVAAAGSVLGMTLFWHCFGTVLTLVPSPISLDAVFLGPRFS